MITAEEAKKISEFNSNYELKRDLKFIDKEIREAANQGLKNALITHDLLTKDVLKSLDACFYTVRDIEMSDIKDPRFKTVPRLEELKAEYKIVTW